jgi:hypothetical protein
MLDGPAQALAPSVGPEVVESCVARDPEKPRSRSRVSDLESGIGLVGIHEHLRRDVFRVGRALDLRADIGVYPAQVGAI